MSLMLYFAWTPLFNELNMIFADEMIEYDISFNEKNELQLLNKNMVEYS